MTAPVIVKMPETPKYFWETNEYTMSFLLPSDNQKKPPKPTDDKVSFSDKMLGRTVQHVSLRLGKIAIMFEFIL